MANDQPKSNKKIPRRYDKPERIIEATEQQRSRETAADWIRQIYEAGDSFRDATGR